MLYTICGWYTFILMLISFLVTIAKDGTSTTEYTGKYKLVSILLQTPMYYFIVMSLFFK